MSDQADSVRTRSCTRLLYIAIRKTPNRTMTARKIQAMPDCSSVAVKMRIQGDVNTEGESFKVARFQRGEVSKGRGCNGLLTAWERSIRGGRALAGLSSEQ